MRRMPSHRFNATLRRERDRRTAVRLLLILLCGLALAGGFVRATTQHVAAVRYGYRSEELRRERARLLEQQRRLQLALDEAASPAKLERAARDIGLEPARAAQVRIVSEGDAASSRPHGYSSSASSR